MYRVAEREVKGENKQKEHIERQNSDPGLCSPEIKSLNEDQQNGPLSGTWFKTTEKGFFIFIVLLLDT